MRLAASVFRPALVLVLAWVAGCANGYLTPGFSSEDGGAAGASVLVGGAPSASDAGSDAALPDGCEKAATLVYVTDDGNRLYSFYPPTLTFTLIGTLSCLASSPTHMTVDRRGVAWVVANGQLYTASTGDASCAALPNWKPDQPYTDFSLTFIGTGAAPDDVLYVMNDTVTLFTFNVVTGARKAVAAVVSVPATEGDMTSASDGSLYFLRDDAVHTLYQVNPTNAAIVKEDTVTAPGYGNQALAFWGGSFYVFENGTIYRFDPSNHTTTMLGTAPMTVTGAGQSTCVPQTPIVK